MDTTSHSYKLGYLEGTIKSAIIQLELENISRDQIKEILIDALKHTGLDND